MDSLISNAKFRSLLTFILILIFKTANAQNNFSLTFRPSVNIPTSDLGNTKINGGSGFEFSAAYKFHPHMDAYAGWGWNNFIENVESENKLEFVETGYSFGLHFIQPLSSTSKLNFIIGGGGIYNHIETENEDGDILYDSGHELGWQIESGLSIPIGHHNKWLLIPNVRYRHLPTEVTIENVKSSVNLEYLSVGVGVSWILGKNK